MHDKEMEVLKNRLLRVSANDFSRSHFVLQLVHQVCLLVLTPKQTFFSIYNRVSTSHGKPGKSWNIVILFSRPGKSLKIIFMEKNRILLENKKGR